MLKGCSVQALPYLRLRMSQWSLSRGIPKKYICAPAFSLLYSNNMQNKNLLIYNHTPTCSQNLEFSAAALNALARILQNSVLFILQPKASSMHGLNHNNKKKICLQGRSYIDIKFCYHRYIIMRSPDLLYLHP